jgi:hypothetical protein
MLGGEAEMAQHDLFIRRQAVSKLAAHMPSAAEIGDVSRKIRTRSQFLSCGGRSHAVLVV